MTDGGFTWQHHMQSCWDVGQLIQKLIIQQWQQSLYGDAQSRIYSTKVRLEGYFWSSLEFKNLFCRGLAKIASKPAWQYLGP